MFALNLKQKLQYGFTLIELTIGIAVLSVALLVMTGSLFPQAQRSVDPWLQVRSAELASSMMNEILARKFDENSYVLGDFRCGESDGTFTAPACVGSELLLANCDIVTNFIYREEGQNAPYESFDDVDDFHCLKLEGNNIINNFNDSYRDFSLKVWVTYFDDPDDPADPDDSNLKVITVEVSHPQSGEITYSAYKANY